MTEMLGSEAFTGPEIVMIGAGIVAGILILIYLAVAYPRFWEVLVVIGTLIFWGD
jgi:hypothetical protein